MPKLLFPKAAVPCAAPRDIAFQICTIQIEQQNPGSLIAAQKPVSAIAIATSPSSR
jgi:hypothetical protein